MPFGIYRQEVRPFTDKQIALVTNFAAQAVIAIENARLLNELRQRTDDLTESLEQQTATAEVLKVISSSPGELEPVFQSMLENATRICGANFGNLLLAEGDAFRTVALHGAPKAFAEERNREPIIRPPPGSDLDQLRKTKKVIHTADIVSVGNAATTAIVKLAGARTFLNVPMIKDNELVGAIGIYRQEVRPFTDKQIELVQNFAAQAVIAIENTRLLSELRDESLEQQTATAEVLEVISSSPGDLEPVFQAMLANATRICGAAFGSMLLAEGDLFRRVAQHNAPPKFAEFHNKTPIIDPKTIRDLKRLVETKQVIHIADVATENPDDPIAIYAGARTLLIVPMLKEDNLIGTIGIYRQEVRPFTDKQIELVSNFAAQAVIAIENTRLLKELRKSLEQQTATSEVLSVISSSPGELEPVFQAMLGSATRICEAKIGILWGFEDGAYRAISMLGITPKYADYLNQGPIRPSPTVGLGRVASTKQTIHIVDTLADQAYAERDPFRVATAEIGGARTLLNVPMLKDGELIGAIGIYRQEVRPFSDKQIELVTNFAAQAVIAIENARLLNELRQRTDDLTESLQQQTATSDILEVISNSPTNSQPAFDAIVQSGLKLFPEAVVVISLPEGDQVKLGAIGGADAGDLKTLSARYPMPLSREFITGTALLDGHEMDFADVRETPEQLMPGRQNFLASGYRAITVMPMMRGETAIGAISVIAREPRQLSEKQRELLRTFAAQAVIAIENTRLFNELRQRTDDLSQSLEQQTATSEVLSVISRSKFDLQPILQSVVDTAVRLCRADQATISRLEGNVLSLRRWLQSRS